MSAPAIPRKNCKACNTEKPMSEFYSHKRDGFQSRCKPCQRAYTKPNDRKIHLRRKFGMSLDQYNNLFRKQSGKCAICEAHQSSLKVSLSVDHNHNTGTLRGLLCTQCNFALGAMREDKDSIKAMITYLERYQ